MNKVVTRNLINKQIKFEDQQKDGNQPIGYNFKTLSREIDAYKNLLESHGAKKGESAIIGRPPGITQTALVFACLELGVSLAIIDYSRGDCFNSYKYMDPKTNIILPIEYFIVYNREDTDKFNFFEKHCEKTICISEFEKQKDYTPNNEVYADSDTIIMKCTSSGTTGTPKKVEHTHNFFHDLIKRNSTFFDKNVGLAFNLNHGSSLATYFFPALYSRNVEKFVNLVPFGTDEVAYIDRLKNFRLDHLMFPYKHYLDVIARINSPQTTYYTLSVIPSSLKGQKYYKDIISIFGSNETSGPVFVNNINNANFLENSYFKIDDFYKINLIDKSLNVTLPVYNKTIDTNDKFYINENGAYIFLGRDDITRINGRNVPKEEYNSIVQKYLDADLVYDYVYQDIYLAVWKNVENLDTYVKRINSKLNSKSRGKHTIKKYKVIDKKEFLTGVKLDQELLREFFRIYP